MRNVLLFAGTTEGKMAADCLAKNNIKTLVSTATEYGKSRIEENEFVSVIAGRLEESDIEKIIIENDFDAVVDATHPFAENISQNIKAACANTNKKYIRLLRNLELNENCIHVDSFKSAVDYLNSVDGNIFVTTGSKNIEEFTLINDFKNRVYLRVLPSVEAIEKCLSLGFDISHIICAQGPFSEEFNICCIKDTNSKFIVTKQTGKLGGFDQKIAAAEKTGINTVVIKAPKSDECSISFSQFKKLLGDNEVIKKHINIVSVGVGDKGNLTLNAINAIDKSQIVIGSKRALECFNLCDKKSFVAIDTHLIKDIIDKSDCSEISVVFSGDTGFYSGAKKLIDNLKYYSLNVISGISSYVYFFNKIQKSYDDVAFFSIHGKSFNFVEAIKKNKKVFILLGGECQAAYVCDSITKAGLGECDVYIGENLSYSNEKIIFNKAKYLTDIKTGSLCVIYIENNNNRGYVFGISDYNFERGNVPMTKSEVRALSMCKLLLKYDSVVYDIGAGTGSVSIECAMAAYKGCVYAVDKNSEAVECLNKNIYKFGAENIKVIEGEATEVIDRLPPPTHCFIGGSSGKMKEIIQKVSKKNPYTRFVVNAITIENAIEAKKAAKEKNCVDIDIINVSISRAKDVNGLSIMTALNPIFIISFTGNGESK